MRYQEILTSATDSEEQPANQNHPAEQGSRWSRIPGLGRLLSVIGRGLSVVEPTSSIHFRREPSSADSDRNASITVISANLCHGWPFQKGQVGRLEAFASLAEQVKADIILLQEVSRSSSLKVDNWLVQRLGMSSMYARANGSHTIGFEEGLAVLSRFPLSQPMLTHLRPAATSLVRRLALGAQVATPAGLLWVFSVHLGLSPRHNFAQQASLREMVSTLPDDQPALLGGDFNSHESTLQMSENKRIWIDTFRYLHPASDGTTHAIKLPGGFSIHQRRLDYIFLRSLLPGWEIQETGHLQSGRQPHSDHHAVYMRMAPLPL